MSVLPARFGSVKEVAAALGMSTDWVRLRIREGSFRAHRVGRPLRIDLDSVEEYLANRAV